MGVRWSKKGRSMGALRQTYPHRFPRVTVSQRCFFDAYQELALATACSYPCGDPDRHGYFARGCVSICVSKRDFLACPYDQHGGLSLSSQASLRGLCESDPRRGLLLELCAASGHRLSRSSADGCLVDLAFDDLIRQFRSIRASPGFCLL